MTKHTILFLAANPVGTDRLALDQEARAIRVELERSGHRDQFELVTRWAAQPLDLLRELRKLKPTVVHFSGHGGHGEPSTLRPNALRNRDIVAGDHPALTSGSDQQYGLFFQGTDGRPQFVSTAMLKETFGAAGASVRLVVLNACYSETHAEALLAYVDCVIGMGGPISDDAARNFAVGFYGGLGDGEPLGRAHKQGCAAISLDGLPESERPKFKARVGVEFKQLVSPSSVAPMLQHGKAIGEKDPVEYYVYISDAKVNMLLPQIADSDRTGVGAMLRHDPNVLPARYRESREHLAERIGGLRSVVKHLRAHNVVGSLDDAPEYVEGIDNLSWGLLQSAEKLLKVQHGSPVSADDVAFFAGYVGNELMLLIGSAYHVIGESRGLHVMGVSSYRCARQLLSVLETESLYFDFDTVRWRCRHSLESLIGPGYPKHKLHFFAKRYGKFGMITLGSPIFVSMVE